jgi:hypothetical protein
VFPMTGRGRGRTGMLGFGANERGGGRGLDEVGGLRVMRVMRGRRILTACVHSIAHLVPGGIGCQARDIYNNKGNAHETKHPEKKMKQVVAYRSLKLILT